MLPACSIVGCGADSAVHRETGITLLEHTCFESGIGYALLIQKTPNTRWRRRLRGAAFGSGGNTRKLPEGRNTPSVFREWMCGLRVGMSPKVCA